MLTIRLQRLGKKNAPTYRLVLAEKGRDTQGRNLELLGTFNPRAKENGFVPNTDRIKYWLEKALSHPTHCIICFCNPVLSAEKRKRKLYTFPLNALQKLQKRKKQPLHK